jgi:AcrR family transcriptional regulator
MRAATIEDITATARRLLLEHGPKAASLRAIAREMKMTAPGLYRYFSSRDELLRHLIATMFRELASDMRRAIEEATPGAEVARSPGEAHEQDHMAQKMVAACKEFRHWALHHKDEFALLFAVTLPALDDRQLDLADQCAHEFAGTFYALYVQMWEAIHFPVPADAEIDPGLRAQLRRFSYTLDAEMPDGAVLVFLRCWSMLYGSISMEVFGHFPFSLEDPAPMFELTLGELVRMVGLEYSAQGAGRNFLPGDDR